MAPPSACAAALGKPSRKPASPRSPSRKTASGIVRVTAAPAVESRPTTATLTPSCANDDAADRPSPLVPPRITARSPTMPKSIALPPLHQKGPCCRRKPNADDARYIILSIIRMAVAGAPSVEPSLSQPAFPAFLAEKALLWQDTHLQNQNIRVDTRRQEKRNATAWHRAAAHHCGSSIFEPSKACQLKPAAIGFRH